MNPDILTSKQAAAELGVAEATLLAWRFRGVGPKYIKLGQLVRYHRDDIRAYLESCKVAPKPREKQPDPMPESMPLVVTE